MTSDHQRIAIAEACGWTVTHWKVNPFDVIARKDGTEYQLKHLPDYLNDLNAINDAEKVLTYDQQIDYSRQVGKLVGSHLPASRAAWIDFGLIKATAAQRAEAFLRTIGKWEESK